MTTNRIIPILKEYMKRDVEAHIQTTFKYIKSCENNGKSGYQNCINFSLSNSDIRFHGNKYGYISLVTNKDGGYDIVINTFNNQRLENEKVIKAFPYRGNWTAEEPKVFEPTLQNKISQYIIDTLIENDFGHKQTPDGYIKAPALSDYIRLSEKTS